MFAPRSSEGRVRSTFHVPSSRQANETIARKGQQKSAPMFVHFIVCSFHSFPLWIE